MSGFLTSCFSIAVIFRLLRSKQFVEVSFVERRIESSDHARPMANPMESEKVDRSVSRFNGKATKLHVRGIVGGAASELLVRTFFGAMKSKFLELSWFRLRLDFQGLFAHKSFYTAF